ncbi:MAG: type III pantothenate kinase [SAR202 cluster bacterium]|nr:type III pantothenate kinase [SAR202 cluster bacterium]|tara:strand:+ start:28097 stop:28879 length:783 start_codon:yes stop_codon:yes gene_type:complete
MLLAVDIGNTNINIGLFDLTKSKDQYNPIFTWKMATAPSRMVDEYGILFGDLLSSQELSVDIVKDVIVSSVVPPLTNVFIEVFKKYFSVIPVVVGSGIKTGVKIVYDSPRDVGSDRIADAAAILKLYSKPAIVVDFGTATVFDAISEEGQYIGGSIVPGIAVSADALYHGTSQLRRVDLKIPDKVIGKNTINALQSGLIVGHISMVEGMITRFKQELTGNPVVVATGGFAELINQNTNVFDYVDLNLTLSGLSCIFELNQ